jgi:hypothetical protein
MAEVDPFSDQLEGWLSDDGPKTLGALGDVFAEKSFAVTVLLLMFIPALPLPTGGISHVFEAIVILLALQMVLGRDTIWLPKRWKHKELGAATTEKAMPFIVRRVRWFERFSRQRGAVLFEKAWMLRLLGLLIAALSVAAITSPPFSGLDTMPAMGAVVIALAIILEDVFILGIGIAIGAGGVALTLTVGAALFKALTSLF